MKLPNKVAHEFLSTTVAVGRGFVGIRGLDEEETALGSFFGRGLADGGPGQGASTRHCCLISPSQLCAAHADWCVIDSILGRH